MEKIENLAEHSISFLLAYGAKLDLANELLASDRDFLALLITEKLANLNRHLENCTHALSEKFFKKKNVRITDINNSLEKLDYITEEWVLPKCQLNTFKYKERGADLEKRIREYRARKKLRKTAESSGGGGIKYIYAEKKMLTDIISLKSNICKKCTEAGVRHLITKNRKSNEAIADKMVRRLIEYQKDIYSLDDIRLSDNPPLMTDTVGIECIYHEYDRPYKGKSVRDKVIDTILHMKGEFKVAKLTRDYKLEPKPGSNHDGAHIWLQSYLDVPTGEDLDYVRLMVMEDASFYNEEFGLPSHWNYLLKEQQKVKELNKKYKKLERVVTEPEILEKFRNSMLKLLRYREDVLGLI